MVVDMKPTTAGQRATVIDPQALTYLMANPARGRKWSVREMAPVLGISPALLGHLCTGERTTVAPDVAQRIADAVGCHPRNLFVGLVSPDSVDSGSAA